MGGEGNAGKEKVEDATKRAAQPSIPGEPEPMKKLIDSYHESSSQHQMLIDNMCCICTTLETSPKRLKKMFIFILGRPS